jgi:hypothetical protein
LKHNVYIFICVNFNGKIKEQLETEEKERAIKQKRDELLEKMKMENEKIKMENEEVVQRKGDMITMILY